MILDTIERLIGSRDAISREEMRDILCALAKQGIDLRNGCMMATLDIDSPYDADSGGHAVSPSAAEAWANACRGIACISVMGEGSADYQSDGQVRYDQPGSMHPMQHATLTFVPADLGHTSTEYMSHHADRVLIVIGDPLELPVPEPTVPSSIERLRQALHVDGTWTRILDDGTLEMRDPNDGQSPAPDDKSRHQYRADPETGELLYRHLPPQSVGDEWIDIGAPEWEVRTQDVMRRPDSPIYAYWEEMVQ